MKNIKNIIFNKYKLEILIFVVEAICMTLELVASRILSPYFGNTYIVWTSIIGIILLSSSLGNFFGGILADKLDNEKCLRFVLTIASLFILMIPISYEKLLEFMKGLSLLTSNIEIGAVLGTFGLFFIPSLALGVITPIILKLRLKSLENSGRTTGTIYAISTLGGIFGTFFSGFVLIPNFGSAYILFGLSLVLLLLILFVQSKPEKMTIWFAVIVAFIDIALFVVYQENNFDSAKKVLNGDMNAVARFDTQYGSVLIYNDYYYDDDPVRVLNIDSGYHSATFIDSDKKNELVYEYLKYYDLMFKSENDINKVLMIGGAGYSYPKYYISHFKDKNMDVVEIDGEITNIAKKYFYLDQLISDYDLNKNNRLKLITEDGRTYLNNNEEKYDAILNDAFSGETPAKTLTTIENIRNIKKSLNENGLYLSNIISSLEGNNSRFLRAEVNTLRQVFKNVYVIPCGKVNDLNQKINIMVISTDQKIDLPDVYNLKISKNEIVITDDYCPIESLTQ